jgi:hypothetical protein
LTGVTEADLAAYLSAIVQWGERYAVTFVGIDEDDGLALGREPDGALVIDLEGRLPNPPRTRPDEIDVFERWRTVPGQGLVRVDYSFELRHRTLDYRRALHHHDEQHFVRQYQVATHEHCEATMGFVACGHYFGFPVQSAIDGMTRLYDTWQSGAKPDCSDLRCLG